MPESEDSMTRKADAKTLLAVEQTIIQSKDYESKEHIWKRLEGIMSRDTFESAISQLLGTGRIMFNGDSVIFTGIDNANLKELFESSVTH
jgi:hypothetical protein